jgi:uncharacterized protein (DUF58 family)
VARRRRSADPPQAEVGDVVLPVPERLLARLEWRTRRRLVGARSGDNATLLRGSGIDVADIREYEPYDDPRHIDWNVTARLDEPYVREYFEDRDATAWLMLDRSASTSFGPVDRSMGTVLVETSLALASLLTRRGNRVGAIVFRDGIEEMIPPAASRTHVLRIASRLAATRPASHAETDLGAVLAAAGGMLRRRSVVILVSDLVGKDGWQRPLGALAHRHDVRVIRLADPREAELPQVGVLWLQDSETGEQVLVDTNDGEFRRRYREAAQMREAAIAADVRRAGAAYHRISTDDDLVDALVRMTTAPALRADPLGVAR